MRHEIHSNNQESSTENRKQFPKISRPIKITPLVIYMHSVHKSRQESVTVAHRKFSRHIDVIKNNNKFQGGVSLSSEVGLMVLSNLLTGAETQHSRATKTVPKAQ